VINGQDYYVRLKVSDGNGYYGTTKPLKIGRIALPQKHLSDNDVNLPANLNIYPNPFVEQINLDLTSSETSDCQWTVYDMTGKIVMNGSKAIEIGNNTLNIDASGLAIGLYTLSALVGSEKHDFRIVKNRF